MQGSRITDDKVEDIIDGSYSSRVCSCSSVRGVLSGDGFVLMKGVVLCPLPARYPVDVNFFPLSMLFPAPHASSFIIEASQAL